MFYKTYYDAGNKLAVEGSFGGQKAIINTICWDGDDVVWLVIASGGFMDGKL
jgi:hypothetical protein